jgi:hypothetical protein
MKRIHHVYVCTTLVEQLTCMHHRKVYKYGPVYSNDTDFGEMDLHPLHIRLFSTTVTTRSTLMEKTRIWKYAFNSGHNK